MQEREETKELLNNPLDSLTKLIDMESDNPQTPHLQTSIPLSKQSLLYLPDSIGSGYFALDSQKP